MTDNIYSRTLARGIDALGGSQALATELHVPESTLLRWASGRAHMPLRAFLKLVELLTKHENAGRDTNSQPVDAKELTFRIGQLAARCSRCDGTEFLPVDPSATRRYTSALRCKACGQEAIHGDLVVQLAHEAVGRAPAASVRRARQQAEATKKIARLANKMPTKDETGSSST